MTVDFVIIPPCDTDSLKRVWKTNVHQFSSTNKLWRHNLLLLHGIVLFLSCTLCQKKLSLKISSLFSSPKIVILRCLIFIVTLNTEKCLSYSINLSHPNISIHILHTVFTFPMVLTRIIYSTIKSFFRWR